MRKLKSGFSISIIIAIMAVMSAFLLSGCEADANKANWEDTLPTVTSRKDKNAIQVMLETSLPTETEVTTTPKTTPRTSATTKVPQLATSNHTSNDDDEDEEINTILSEFSTVTVFPNVPVNEFTTTTASYPIVTTVPTLPADIFDDNDDFNNFNDFDDLDILNDVDGIDLDQNSVRSERAAISQDGDIVSSFDSVDEISVLEVYQRELDRPYSYESLNTTQKYVYDSIINAVENYKTEFTIPAAVNVSAQDYKAVYQLLYNDENAIFYIGTQVNYSTVSGEKKIVIQYKYSVEQIKRMQAEIDKATNAILAKIHDNMTEYEIVKLLFDEIAGNCVYDASAANCSDIYGCLVNKKAICGGLSKTFGYLCSKAGIESLIITGDYDVPHMWNMVNIDSEWYHIDVTAGIVSNSANKYIRYDYFCVTDDFIVNTRSIYEQDYEYPLAIFDTYNYYEFNSLKAYSYNDAVQILTQSIINAAKVKDTTIQFSCSDEAVYDEVVKKFFSREYAQALNIFDVAYSRCQNKYNRETINYNTDNQTLVIKVFIKYLD